MHKLHKVNSVYIRGVKMITLLCCYNDKDCLNNMLIPSINKQNRKIETIFIDNTKGKYKSAAEAYNREFEKAKGDILLFSHQDIIFEKEDFIEQIEKIFSEKTNSMIGLAGIKKDGKVYSNLKYYRSKEYITKERIIDNVEEVESIDECFFAIKREHFDKLYFDEKICDNWHLYAVELCYRGRYEQNLNIGVVDVPAYHKMESGTGLEVDEMFLRTLSRICEKYKKKEKLIYAPCYVVQTKGIKKYYKIIKTKLKLKLRKGKNK